MGFGPTGSSEVGRAAALGCLLKRVSDFDQTRLAARQTGKGNAKRCWLRHKTGWKITGVCDHAEWHHNRRIASLGQEAAAAAAGKNNSIEFMTLHHSVSAIGT